MKRTRSCWCENDSDLSMVRKKRREHFPWAGRGEKLIVSPQKKQEGLRKKTSRANPVIREKRGNKPTSKGGKEGRKCLFGFEGGRRGYTVLTRHFVEEKGKKRKRGEPKKRSLLKRERDLPVIPSI